MTRSAFDEIRDDEYAPAHEAAQLGLLLINSLEDHAHLRDARVAYLLRDEEITEKGKVEWASAHLAGFQGPSLKRWRRYLQWNLVRMFGFQPDFIMLIDRNIWAGLDLRQKLALVDHELCHMAQATDADGAPRFNQVTGEPIWVIRGHDVEEFGSVVERHGLWNDDLLTFARVIVDALGSGPAMDLPAQTG